MTLPVTLPMNPPCAVTNCVVVFTITVLSSATMLTFKSPPGIPIADPPMVDPAGRFTAVPVAVIVAAPNFILDPLRYKSLNLYVALPRS